MSDSTTEFELTGGALCLDFANTLGDRPRCCEEHLDGYEDLLRWSRQADALGAAEFDCLEREAGKHPRLAQAAFERASALRETVYRIFAALARDQQPASDDVQTLNSALHAALPHLELRDAEGGGGTTQSEGTSSGQQGFTWAWGEPDGSLDRMLWPVIRSAADLLTSEEATMIRECDSENCSWLFVDRSRTRRRRWCDMSTCGNRAKARRHYQRLKRERSPG